MVKIQLKSVVLVTVLLGLASAQAETTSASVEKASSENTTSTSSDSLLKNKQYEDTKALTDPALRTSDGSLSRYSFKGSFSYYGPELSNLSSQNQPNPDGTNGTYSQRASGSVTMNYRNSATTSFAAGTGITDNYPFSGSPVFNTNNPFLAYNMASRFGNLQMLNSPELIDTTNPVYTRTGEVAGVEWYNGLVYNFENSHWAVSADTTAYYWIFGRDYVKSDSSKGAVQQYVINFKPGVKYNITDRLVSYTNMGIEWFNIRDNSGDYSVLVHRAPSLNLGIGYAYSRDIYVSPYFITYPWTGSTPTTGPTLTQNETTFNFTTTFNLL